MGKYFIAIIDQLQRILAKTIPNFANVTADQLNTGLSETLRNEINQLWPIQTGQTTSYATGDDGYYQYGRLANFTTLLSPNFWGNTARFTSNLGQTFPVLNNDTTPCPYTYIVDNATGLGWSVVYQATANWATAVATGSTYTLTSNGETYSDFHLPNLTEMLSIANWSCSNGGTTSEPYNYTVFNQIASGGLAAVWTSTTPPLTTSAFQINVVGTGILTIVAKTNTRNYFMVRRHF